MTNKNIERELFLLESLFYNANTSWQHSGSTPRENKRKLYKFKYLRVFEGAFKWLRVHHNVEINLRI